MKFLNCVTVTGADDGISPVELANLTIAYSFVEWGILVSKSSYGEGKPRYPSDKWLQELFALCRRERESPHIPNEPLSLSLHICGKWIRDICEGNWTIAAELSGFSWDLFERVQLNFSPYLDRIDPVTFANAIPDILKHKEIIFQINPKDFADTSNERFIKLFRMIALTNFKTSVLYDSSGGLGVVPDCWTHPLRPFVWSSNNSAPPEFGLHRVGFAGGLSPANFEAQLAGITQVSGDDSPCWIDTESGIRTEEKFDSTKVVEFLTKSKPFLKDNWYE